jgi:hypothetical protein
MHKKYPLFGQLGLQNGGMPLLMEKRIAAVSRGTGVGISLPSVAAKLMPHRFSHTGKRPWAAA